MPKLKKGKWTPEEVSKLQLIPKDGNQRSKLTKAAKSLGRSYPNVYGKWADLLKNPANVEDDVILFTVDENIKEPSRFDSAEIARLKRGLDMPNAIPALEIGKNSLPIANKYTTYARKHLDENYHEGNYYIQKEKKNGELTGFSRIFKRP